MLPQFVAAAPAFAAGRVRDALREAYVNIDKHLSLNPAYRDDRSGCTAVSVFVSEREIICANAGDSRCVLCRAGRAVALSVDHKPTLPMERRRIERAKGFVMNRRVNGVLALSRAIGDFAFKRRPFVPWEEQAVTSLPDVVATAIDRSTDEFIVLACDGIWDVMSSEAVVAFVRTRLLGGAAPRAVAEMLMDACLSTSPFGVGCDNMSVMVIALRGTHALESRYASLFTAAAAANATAAGFGVTSPGGAFSVNHLTASNLKESPARAAAILTAAVAAGAAEVGVAERGSSQPSVN
jgi:serine/threonine protein phosphatase PrpC